MDWRKHIERNPKVMLGKPVVKGTRITVELIVERLGQGWTQADLLASFPHLKAQHIQAALMYASKSLAGDEVVVLERRA